MADEMRHMEPNNPRKQKSENNFPTSLGTDNSFPEKEFPCSFPDADKGLFS